MTKRKIVGWLVFAVLGVVLLFQLPRLVARGFVQLGSFNLSMKRYQQAEKAFLQARDIWDESCASCGLGTAYYRLGRFNDAEKAFKRAINLNANDVCAYEHSGRMYYDLRKYPEAIAAFKRVSELSPNFNGYMFLGHSYVYSQEYQAGVDAYKKAIRLRPKDAEAQVQLGIAYDYLDRREEAVAAYKEAIKLDPDDTRAHYYLALAYLALNNKPAALAEYEILRKLDPENVAETFEDLVLSQGRESGKEKLYLVPLNNFPASSLDRLVTYYKEKTGIEAIPTEPLQLRLAAADKLRQQLVAEEVIGLVKRSHSKLASDPNAILIAVTDEDMYIRKKNWQFAFSYRAEGRFAVVSSARMNPINFGDSADEDLLERRMRKMIMKQIGLLYYQMPTTRNPRSVLFNDIRSVKDLDQMGEDF